MQPIDGGDVLVVDDDDDMAAVLVMMLELAGYRARSVGNGQEALDAVAARRPALVLLDMLMPVMDGWDCARALRARYGRQLRIVVVTAAEHLRARTRDLDVDGVLPKPFEIDELVRVVSRYIGAPGHAMPPTAP
jgi:CheY-like chemotaxis protein